MGVASFPLVHVVMVPEAFQKKLEPMHYSVDKVSQPYPPPSEVHQLIASNKAIEVRLRKIEEQSILLKESVDSVKDLLEKQIENQFQIKGSIYEVGYPTCIYSILRK